MFIDLSHTIENGLITYDGLPAPIIGDFLSREESRVHYSAGTEFQIARIDMVGNTGTYIDCPFHRYADGADFAGTDIGQCADLDGVVVHAEYSRSRKIGEEIFQGIGIRDRAVLVHTGWDVFWNTREYQVNHPFLTEGAARFLRDEGARLVGIDSKNIDDTRTTSRPVHSTLLAAGIFIVEHLCNLSSLPESGFSFTALPPRIKGVGSFPVRAFARRANSAVR